MRARVREYQTTRETLEAALRRTPTFGEMATQLGTTVAEIVELDDLATLSTYMVPLSMVEDAPGGLSATTWLDPNAGSNLASMHEEVKLALLRITERQRQVLVLHFLEGFQKSEIAETLGIDRSRVTQLLHQGLRNLRTELGELRT
jgi:RNA polymerase sigma factor for flagellar operon FliA